MTPRVTPDTRGHPLVLEKGKTLGSGPDVLFPCRRSPQSRRQLARVAKKIPQVLLHEAVEHRLYGDGAANTSVRDEHAPRFADGVPLPRCRDIACLRATAAVRAIFPLSRNSPVTGLLFTPIEALASAGTQRGTLVTVRESEDADTAYERASPAMPRDSDAVVHERFNLHAGVTLGADDDVGRERLCRYLMRPAFSLSRPWNS